MQASIATGRFRRRALSNAMLTLVTLIALAGMMLSPIGDQIALAQTGDEQAPPAEEAEEVEEPVPPTESAPEPPPATEAPPEEIEEPALEPTAVATEAAATEAVMPETSRLTISVYRCDHPTFDPYFSSNAQMVLDTCVSPGAGTFTVNSVGSQETQSGGSLAFEVLGGLDIQEQFQPGYDNAIANCVLYGPDGVLADQIGPGEANGGYWKVGSIAGDVHCDWYQVDRGIGVVYIVNMACPGPVGFPAPTMDELVAICTEPAGPILFGVQHGQIQAQTGTSGGEFNDVFFDSVQTGPIAIWAEPPARFESARVFCQVNTVAGVELVPFAEVSAPDFRVTSLTLGHDQRLHCAWFNILEGPGLALPDDEPAPTDEPILEDPGAQPTATVPPGGNPSELTIRLHTCSAGYDPEAPGATPNIDCPLGPNGVNFSLVDQDPDTADLQTMTGDSIDNAVTFGGLAAGDYTVTETVPGGTAAVFVLGCGAGGGIDPIPVFVINGTVDIGLPQGVLLTCHWFNIPEVGSQPVAREGALDATPGIAAALTGTASLTMYAYACPAGFDVDAVDANPQASCTLADGVSFEMDDAVDDGGGWMFETGWTGTGYHAIDGLAADTYTITESARNGVTSTFVWDCYDLAGSSARTDPLAMGNLLVYDLADGAQIRCDWFNVTGGAGRVIVNTHGCDYLVPAYTLAYELLGAQCTLDPGTIEFTVVSDTHQETQAASQVPLRLASFASVPSGYVAVVERLPDGWGTPIVYCQVSLENGEPVSPPEQLEVYVGRQVNFPLEPGQVVSCDWYNVAQGFVDVHIATHACAEGFDAYAAGLTDLVIGCTADPGIIDFTVEANPLYLQTRTATAAATADFMDVPSGQLRMGQELPAGYGLPVVFCRLDFEDGSNVAPAVRMTVGTNSTITTPLSAGQVLNCDWYNVPGGFGMVSIWSQSCPEGFDAQTATRIELELQCADDIPDIAYGLASGSFDAIASSTNLFRYADFNAVPAGPLTVVQTPPGNYDDAIAYCRVQEDGQPVTPAARVDVASGTLTWDLGPNQWLICRWYIAHDAGGTVTVNTFECPKGTAYDHDAGWYSQHCTAPHNGIEFNLTHSGGLDPEVTANGVVEWAGVPLGPVSIQEYLPPEYGEPVVFCGVVSSSGGPLDAVAKRVESPGGYVETRFDYPNTRYLCYWYNIPGGPGEITVHKDTCPPGYDLYASGADPARDCAETTNGVSFTLSGSGNEAEATTGAAVDGAVSFGDLAPGPYTVTESMPPGTASAFVLDCTGGKMGAIRPYPLATGDTLQVEVGAGESIVCHWYNVPEHEGGRLTVIKYTCATLTYVSDVDCEIYESGQGFDLVYWNGEAWEYHSTAETDGAGRTTFVDLTPGEYWLDEHEREWCDLTSDEISDDGNWLNVSDAGETVVSVYNCGTDPGAQGKSGATPAKYPNTGVAPNEPPPMREAP